MPNGAAVALPFAPVELPATFDEHLGGAEGWIAAIVTELADVSVSAVPEIEAGGLTNQTRLTGGDLLGQLVVVRFQIGEREFAAAVHRVGRTRRGAPLSAAVIDDVIEIVTEVAAAVRAMN